MDGVKLDINDLKSRKENGKAKKIDIDDLRYDEMIDAQIENYRNKGKMTIQDIMAMQQLEDMKWERRQRMKAESQPAPQSPQIDIEEIIRKATEPLNEQIRELKRQQEKAEEEKRWDNIQKQIDSLKDIVISGSRKKNDDDDPILKQIQSLQQELKDEKEKARKKEEETFRDSLKNMIYDLNDQIADLKSKPGKSQSEVEQIIEAEKKRGELLRALGVKNEKEDEAGVLDVVDSLTDKIPKWAKTASTVREVFSKDSEIPDDVPDNVPTNLPQRNEPIPQRSTIPSDIKEFLDRGRVENGTYIDYAGTPWVNLEGNPISRKDIEDLALTNPEDVRRLMKETDEAYRKQQEKKAEKPKPKSDDVFIQSGQERVHTASPPKQPEPEKQEAKTETPPEPEQNPDDTDLKEAMSYIESGKEIEDPENGKGWVGTKNEYYRDDEGKPLTKEELIAMARENPKEFMSDVRQHLASLEGDSNGE
ncbi:MAG: hypothetical protein M1285_05615 [Candidatus Thermoplasmatota archaeon]|nr:hypothetical protein [Candidatus Thermoplasmatota archaeon]